MLPSPQALLALQGRYRGCGLLIPDAPPVTTTLVVCNLRQQKQANGMETIRAGLRFDDLPRGADTLIQRYIFRESLMGLLLVLGVIMLAIVLVDVVEQMRTVGTRTEIGIGTAFSLTLLDMPRLILETLPFAMLVGSILTFSRLSRRSEIPAIRAAGVSAWRFLGPAIVLGLLTGIVMVTVLDPLATRSTLEFENKRAALLDTRSAAANADSRDGVWLSQGDADRDKSKPGDLQGQAIISAKRIVGRAEALEDVTFYYFKPGPDGDRDFAYRIDAKRAELRRTDGNARTPWDQLQVEAVIAALGGGEGFDRVPEITVLVDNETLRGGLHDHSVCETDQATPLPVSTVRRLEIRVARSCATSVES